MCEQRWCEDWCDPVVLDRGANIIYPLQIAYNGLPELQKSYKVVFWYNPLSAMKHR